MSRWQALAPARLGAAGAATGWGLEKGASIWAGNGDPLVQDFLGGKVYGKARRWPEISEANKDAIENPNLIRPGWELRIADK